jgi:hypothetical protein
MSRRIPAPALCALLVWAAVPGARAQSDLGIPRLHVDTVRIHWSEVAGAAGYDLIRGGLFRLLRSGGDFSEATAECVVDHTPLLGVEFIQSPSKDEAFWFLVRAENDAGPGTYDDPVDAGLVASRDPGIAASPFACP